MHFAGGGRIMEPSRGALHIMADNVLAHDSIWYL